MAVLSAVLALALAGLAYLSHIHQLGFPDGTVTELGRAQQRLAWVFLVFSAAIGCWLARLGLGAGPVRLRQVLTGLGLHALGTGGAWAVNLYLMAHLTGSGGG